jgi:hypothetical protein
LLPLGVLSQIPAGAFQPLRMALEQPGDHRPYKTSGSERILMPRLVSAS